MKKLLLFITIMVMTMSSVSADLYYDGTNAKEWKIFTSIKGEVTSVNGTYNLSGRGMKTGYVLSFPTLKEDMNTIEWRMKYSEYYAIYFLVNTSKGIRYLRYSSLNRDKGIHGRFMSFGLETSSMDGKWHTFKRNLKDDLAKFDPTNRLLSVKAFMIRGSGNLDDIRVAEATTTPLDNLDMKTFNNLLNAKKREYETAEVNPQAADIKHHGENLFLAEMKLSFMGDVNKVEFYSYTNANNENKLVKLFDIKPVQDTGYTITLQNSDKELVAKYLTQKGNWMVKRIDTYSISPILSTHLIRTQEIPYE